MRLTATRKASSYRQARLGERRDLVAQVIFQLLHVRAWMARTTAQIFAPVRDLLFERDVAS